MKKPSKKYWEDRAAGRMVSYTAKAESTADTLGKAYYAVARYLQGEANGILSTFADKFGLSIAEAETMLKNAPDKPMFEQMKTALATCADEQKKQQLETLLSSPAYAHRIGRLNDLDSKISDMCSRLANTEIGVDTEHLSDIVQSAYMQTVFDVTKGADYRAAFDLIPESRVKAILSTNWSGQMFSQRVWDNTDALADGLKHDMLVGIMAGKSEQHMADDIMNRCGVGAFEARRLVRTETTCVANMAELYGYKELDIDEYEFSACLDSRTSDLCRELDGKVFKRNSAQAGVNLPPMHPFCRSTTLPVLPSEEDLDKELAELGDEIGADVDFDEWERNLQQGEDGKWWYVAGSADTAIQTAAMSAKETVSGFTPAKSIEEAQAYAQQFIEAQFGDKTFKGKADFKGVSLENANEINRALEELFDKYDIPKISGIKAIDPLSAKGKKIFSSADAVMAYSPVKQGIYINKNVLKNAETIAAYNKQAKDAWDTVMSNIDTLNGAEKELALRYKQAGRSIVGDGSVHDYFLHEMGHHVQWQAFDAKTNNLIGSQMSQYAGNLSGYATASKSEYFAESFVALQKGEISKLDPEYVAFMKGRTIDKVGESGIINTGAVSGALNPMSKQAEQHAVRYYESVRHMKTDTMKISEATGISKDKLDKIKDHVFIKEHELIDGKRRFDPDYEMAQSWQRLLSGDYKEQDIVLLKHEYAELRYMEKGLSQSEAHIKASRKYNFAKYCE